MKKRFGTGKKMPLSENRLCLKIFIFRLLPHAISC